MKEGKPQLDFCLLIPCYNNREGLIRSLASVKYYPDSFLVVIVDDGSTQPLVKEEIEKEADLPLIILHLDKNKGITTALNTGLAWIGQHCRTKYIARLDCGDTCDPERFYMQVAAMDSFPEVGLSGTWCIFEERGQKTRYEYKTPVTHEEIKKEMYSRNVFIHPTVIFQEKLLQEVGYYPEGFDPAEDYAYFWKIMLLKQTFVLNKFLVTCEINKSGISYKNRGKQLAARQRVIQKFGTRPFLKISSILRLWMLFIIPKRLLLLLKSFKS